MELLVVIAIITLLLAILLPGLQYARKQAISVACEENLHQWGIILEAYTDNNDGRFFRGMLDGSWNDWIEILRPSYVKKGGITCCPAATKTRDKGGRGVFVAWSDEEGDYGSYGLNAWVCDAEKGTVFGDKLYFRHTGFKGRQNIPVFADCLGIASWPDQNSLPPEYNGQLPLKTTLTEQMKDFCINRHPKGTVNCLFMDWSARPVGLKELWKLKWHRNFDTQGPWTRTGGAKPGDWPAWMKGFKNY